MSLDKGSDLTRIQHKDASKTYAQADDSLEAQSDAATTAYDYLKTMRFTQTLPLASTVQAVTSSSATALTQPATVTITYPTDATKKMVYVKARLYAMNNSANAHLISLKLQRNYAAGGLTDIRDLSASTSLGMPATTGTWSFIELEEDITSVIAATGNTITFAWEVNSDDANSVIYTQNFVVTVEYDLSGT